MKDVSFNEAIFKLKENILLNDRIDQVNIIYFKNEVSKLTELVSLLKNNLCFKEELAKERISISLLEIDIDLIDDKLFKGLVKANPKVLNIVLTDGYINKSLNKDKLSSKVKNIFSSINLILKVNNDFRNYQNVKVLATDYTIVKSSIIKYLKGSLLNKKEVLNLSEDLEKNLNFLILKIAEFVFSNYTEIVFKEYKDRKKQKSNIFPFLSQTEIA